MTKPVGLVGPMIRNEAPWFCCSDIRSRQNSLPLRLAAVGPPHFGANRMPRIAEKISRLYGL
jgi:hypothetical protein